MRLAFSTIACPELTLDRAVHLASTLGFQGLEFRTLGEDDTTLACEPFLTGPLKVRELCDDAAVSPACFATSIRYDEPVFPPVIGRVIGDFERPVRATKRVVEMAALMDCPLVRVFAFELQPRERRNAGLRRILERLDLAAATARNTGVRLVLENGGSFPTAADLAEIIDLIDRPTLAAAYSPAVAMAAGEDPVEGVRLLGSRLASVKLRDARDGQQVVLGQGDVPNEAVVRELAAARFEGWAVVEWDRLWSPDQGGLEAALRDAAGSFYRWSAGPMSELERRKFTGVA